MENEKCLGCKNYDTEWPCVMGVKCYSFYPDDYRKKDYFEPKEDGKRMYEEMMGQADKYIAKAVNTNDVDLKKFYFNVSRNYERMARELTIEEAGNNAKF